MSRLIIVSNRLPFSIENSGDGPQLRQSSGGLVSAIKGYFEKSGIQQQKFNGRIWVGSVDFSPQEYDKVKNEIASENIKVEPVFIDKKLYKDYYNGFSNSVLWPLFHYFPSLVEYKKEYFEAYQRVNEQFADKLLSIIKDDDVVWVHDYQLTMVPQLLRRKKKDLSIGFFLHIPFPSYEILRLLPSEWKMAVVSGMLGADLIGFHTHDYVQHFIQSAKMLVGVDNQFNMLQYRNRIIRTDLFPIGIDYEKFQQAANDADIIVQKENVCSSFTDKKIIFSVDRQDYTKGLMYRLKGYEEFLDNHPEWKEKVIFILNVIPSRNDIPTYLERKKSLEERIGTINGKFSTLQWQPLIYRYNHLSFGELAALYQAADVALITPLRDGMNLVAKEYVASCVNQTGVLILSELTGAASELNEALLVNPTDTAEVSNAIAHSLTMPIFEQKQRMALMQKRLKEYDVVRWVNDFLEQLHNTKEEQNKLRIKIINDKAITKILHDYANAPTRVILLDYDGTLTAFTRIPADAIPSAQLLELLTKLSADTRNELVIISGRDSNTLQEWLGHLPVTLVAEHGAAVKPRGRDWEVQTTTDTSWKEQIRPIMQLFVTRCAGSFVEEKENTLAWHYRNTHPDLGFTRSRELMNTLLQLITNTSLQVIDGNKVLEVRLAGVDKGVTALKLLNNFNPAFTLCLGDDVTDEDMFKALNSRGYTIKIGSGSTAAQYNIPTQQEVLPFLEQFILPVKNSKRHVHTQV
ncbi:MAG TPA: bifunctional alpha,alpha-trehalose-phosphate synthase (UDP-forming)/trehalose-phosphatase [Chitinophagaceae bacterium]|nr:bifunctional alpha,alpha-trehalose-phosphate synthase (UDP-forming)/trehalose-phosphatase [Chitinophagaceae bacterium]